jgi:hypothetical protein
MTADWRMNIDTDEGAVWFGTSDLTSADQAELTSSVCQALGAVVAARKRLVWVERQDLRRESWSVPLFHDEDGSSHLELGHLKPLERACVVARLRESGFRE